VDFAWNPTDEWVVASVDEDNILQVIGESREERAESREQRAESCMFYVALSVPL
jgi:hypothetical protein